MTAEQWVDALQQRHRSSFTTSEFLKAVRALSARYVERRSSIREKSPLDSDGKKAAFAAFYAPLHFVTVREIVRRLPRDQPPQLIVDLGCGTGIVSAAWSTELATPAKLLGVDAHPWALSEAGWNWRQLGLRGDVQRGDLVRAAQRLLLTWRPASAGPTAGPPEGGRYGLVAGWSVNELSDDARADLLPTLLELGRRGAQVLVIEPLAKSAVPWWNEWASAFGAAGGHAAEWRVDAELPHVLHEISEAAGFRREELTARTLVLRGDSVGIQASGGLAL